MKKRYFYLLVILSIFKLGKGQRDFDFGVRVNQAVMQKITSNTDKCTFLATDYTTFLQIKSAGVFFGITALNNYKTAPGAGAGGIGCLNAGLFFKLSDIGKKGFLCLYIYDIHFYSGSSQTLDVITLNPRYRYNLLKNYFSVEAGITLGITRDYFSAFYYPNSFVRSTIGANVSIGLNILALVAKN